MIDENVLVARLEEKIKVTSLEIIVTGTKDKPYFEIKYKEVGKEDYNIGYSSYDLNNVFNWKEECFEIVNQLAEEQMQCIKSSCSNCETYDNEKHYCPKWCDVIENTVKELAEEMGVSKMENTNDDFCEWKCESGNQKMMAVWNTSCDRKRIMQKTEGEKYCTYCGKQIKVVPYQPKE